jgi:hypothetical protein
MQESGVSQNALLNEFCDHDPPATASPSRENAPLFKADTVNIAVSAPKDREIAWFRPDGTTLRSS